MCKKITFLTFAAVVSSLASLALAEPLWNDLKITFGKKYDKCDANKCSGLDTHGNQNEHLMQKLPRTKKDLDHSKWKRIDSSIGCGNNGKFNGEQWINIKKPHSQALLFDVQGTIAGIQYFMPLAETTNSHDPDRYDYSKQPQIQFMKIDDVKYLYVTVYFIEPCHICTEGRPETELESVGTAKNLYYQNGSTPMEFVRLPLNRIQATKDGFSENKCFDTMGWHGYFDVNSWQEDNCRTYSPIFLMFNNGGRLVAFGFLLTGKATAPAIERPNAQTVSYFSTQVNGTAAPQCVREVGEKQGFSSMHVFLTDRPHEFKCELPYNAPGYFSSTYFHYLQDKLYTLLHPISCPTSNEAMNEL